MKRFLEIAAAILLLLLGLDVFIVRLFENSLGSIPLFGNGLLSDGFWMSPEMGSYRRFILISNLIRLLFSLTLVILLILNKREKLKLIILSILSLFYEYLFVYFKIWSSYPAISLQYFYEFIISVVLTLMFIFYFRNNREYIRSLYLKSFCLVSFLLLVLFAVFIGFTKMAKHRIDDEKVQDIMKSKFDTANIYSTHVMIQDPDYYLLTKRALKNYSDIFSIGDRLYMMAQLDNNKDFQWNSEILSGSAILLTNKEIYDTISSYSPKDFWEAFHRKYKTNLSFLTKPLFSLSGNYAIIEYSYFCGSLCGWGGILILKKERNKWIVIKTGIESWIS